MRILIFSGTSSGDCRFDLFEALAKRHEVTVISPSFDRHSGFKFESFMEKNGLRRLRPFQLCTKSIMANMVPYLVDSIHKAASLNKFDIIHILRPNPINFAGILAKRLHQIPIVLDFNDLDSLVMKEEGHSLWAQSIMRAFERYFPKEAEHIIVCSSALRDYLVQLGVDEKKITWVPNGVNTSRFYPEKTSINLKRKMGLKKYVVTYLGNLNQPDLVEPLINAMKIIDQKREDVSCLIVGNGTHRTRLMTLSEEYGLTGSVTFTGRVSSVAKYLWITDVSIAYLPDKAFAKYASNVKLFEYMAAATAPIVSDIGDLPYYVDYGKAGVVVKANNTNKLAKAILDLLGNDEKRQEISTKAQQYAATRYDWNLLSQKVEKVYQKVVSNTRS